jgi:hypothetical protein
MAPALAARLAAAAAEQHRHLRDVLRDAVERYLRELRPLTSTRRSPAEAVARMWASRSGNKLPDGIIIRHLTTFGRA